MSKIASFNDFEEKLIKTGVITDKEHLSDESKEQLKEVYKKTIESSRDSGMEFNAMIDKVIDIYKNELNKPDIFWEQKKEIFDRVDKQLDRKEKDIKDERKFLLWQSYGLAAALLGTVAVVAPKAIAAYTDNIKK